MVFQKLKSEFMTSDDTKKCFSLVFFIIFFLNKLKCKFFYKNEFKLHNVCGIFNLRLDGEKRFS